MKKKILTCILVLTLITTVSCSKKDNKSSGTDNSKITPEVVTENNQIENDEEKFVVKNGEHPMAEDIVIVLSEEFINGKGSINITNNSIYDISYFSLDLSDNNGNIINIKYDKELRKEGGYDKFFKVKIDPSLNYDDFKPIYHELEFKNKNVEKEISKYDYDLKEYY